MVRPTSKQEKLHEAPCAKVVFLNTLVVSRKWSGLTNTHKRSVKEAVNLTIQ